MKLIILLALLIPSLLFGEVETDNNVAGVLEIISAASTQWVSAIKPAGLWLFFTFITIDFVLTFGLMAVKGADFGGIWVEVLRKILIIGFFLAIFESIDYLKMIPASFAQIATNATSRDIEPDTILEVAMNLVMSLWDGMSITDVGRSIAAVIAGVICLIAFGLMAAQLFMTLVKIQMLIAGSYIVFSLAGWSYTLSMATSPIKALFAAGMELMFIKLVLALTIDTIENLQTTVGNDTGSYVAVIVLSIVLVSIVQMINGVVNSLLSGTLGGNSTSGLGVAAGVVGGAAAGVAASAKHGAGMHEAIKEARKKSANGQGSTMGNLGRAIGEDFANTIKGKNARSTTSVGERAAETIRKNK
ncbi:P-type conjugative transfer protein TrbL [Sulfuricurvum sp.]|uniref:P-type conjugative transfer protein TrbL n=1 Tax=Sulfuricurvum sp. TaxID=2025608 RepID=UPI002616B29D|nr:P-type conjugative transfer protein TrbL [Sulfuricurvum sp.]MDD2782293.1 P-type conjugative transfer protein TrbL [Sulfuricurvum sp.]